MKLDRFTTINFQKAIEVTFGVMLFLVPLIFFPKTSEIFEFNKMNFVYLCASLIFTFWIGRTLTEKNYTFNKTPLFWPLVAFLAVYVVSTIFSIDKYTAVFGYYSRLNGGLLSIIAYILLYFAFVSNVTKSFIEKLIKIVIYSTVAVSLWAVSEHFGASPSCIFISGELNTECWIQDVSYRVFATFGQPNWLASWMVAIIPLAWYKLARDKEKRLWFLASVLFFITLLFTKSRSGLLAFGITTVIFGAIYLLTVKFKKRPFFRRIPLLLTTSYLLLAALIGTPWTPNLQQLIERQNSSELSIEDQSSAINEGGTESGEIRKIVWKGAIRIWQNNPLIGTGPETFAYSYYNYRPVEHNETSEWYFLYNKAHNEYLNYAANIGTLGLLSYVSIICFSIYIFVKNLGTKRKILNTSLLASYFGLLITNFFGFSVVATNLLIFLLPAFSVIAASPNKKAANKKIISKDLIITTLIGLFLLSLIVRYWLADYMFAQGKSNASNQQYKNAENYILKAQSLSKNNPLYYDEVAKVYDDVAVLEAEDGNKEIALEYGELALQQSDIALSRSPRNVLFRKNRSNILTDLSFIDDTYISETITALENIILLAPTDARAFYNLGLMYERMDDDKKAIDLLEKSIEMKQNYKEARIAVALLYKRNEKFNKAESHLQYILDNIAPDDTRVYQMLQDVKNEKHK